VRGRLRLPYMPVWVNAFRCGESHLWCQVGRIGAIALVDLDGQVRQASGRGVLNPSRMGSLHPDQFTLWPSSEKNGSRSREDLDVRSDTSPQNTRAKRRS
jgi:hypothetical protein